MSDPTPLDLLSAIDGDDPSPETMGRIRARLERALDDDADPVAPRDIDRREVIVVERTMEESSTEVLGGVRRQWPIVAAAAIAIVVGIVIGVLATGDDGATTTASGDGDPASVLRAYEEASNTRDIDAIMAFYDDDAVVLDGPFDALARGHDEIREGERFSVGLYDADRGIEFRNLVVDGNTVTFDHVFRNFEGVCYSGEGHEVTVIGDKIVLYDWGDRVVNGSLCPQE
ncbi:MAG: nuclear transport factor 2 family protein [Actinomycetota bacterium]